VGCIALFSNQTESIKYYGESLSSIGNAGSSVSEETSTGSNGWSDAFDYDDSEQESAVPSSPSLSAGIFSSTNDDSEETEDDFHEPASSSHDESYDFASAYGAPKSESRSAPAAPSTVHSGDNVQVHYVVRLASTGKEVYRQEGAGDGGTFSYEAGAGHVIPGFDSMIDGMKVGESKSGVVIPSDQAYGGKGFKAMGIPANADLEYDVEVVGKN
jgi:FKBP-type peptidyl-prolyl cis-trans isomerase